MRESNIAPEEIPAPILNKIYWWAELLLNRGYPLPNPVSGKKSEFEDAEMETIKARVEPQPVREG
jgi:hypothetical protein